MEGWIAFGVVCIIAIILARSRAKMSKKITVLREEKMDAESKLQIANGLAEGSEDRYKIIVADIIKTQNEAFKTEATRPVIDTVSTLNENIAKLQLQNEKHVTEFNANMANMSETAKDMMRETSVLSDVLKSSQKRGRHAEIGLERIFEMSNLIKGVHYTTQQTSETGQRPDFVVKLSEDRNVIIDSKAPLEALWESYDTEDEIKKTEALNRHVTAVKKHITTLDKRDYTGNQASTLEYVVMVVPEYALLPALGHEEGLIEYALERHVILATHSTLMVLLRTVELMWKQSEMTESVKEIGDLSLDVYEQLCKFTSYHAKTGKELEDAVKAYNSSVGSLDSKVLPKTKKLAEISSSTKKMPEVTVINRAVKQLPKDSQ